MDRQSVRFWKKSIYMDRQSVYITSVPPWLWSFSLFLEDWLYRLTDNPDDGTAAMTRRQLPHLARALAHSAQGWNIPFGNPSLRPMTGNVINPCLCSSFTLLSQPSHLSTVPACCVFNWSRLCWYMYCLLCHRHRSFFCLGYFVTPFLYDFPRMPQSS